MSRRRIIILTCLLALYVGSYAVLSRRGFELSDQYGLKGSFWFLEPHPTAAWEATHFGCMVFYAPLIAVDYHLVGGRGPGNVPLFGLSK
jgi:hypothetical protein